MAKKAKKIETKAKKKKWCTILAPKIFLEQEVGETVFELPKDLVGRRVTVNLMTLTGDPKKQSFNLTLEITDVKESTANTQCVAWEMTHASVKRLVRRGRERLDDSFVVATSDGQIVRVKPFLLTRFNTSRSVTKSLGKSLQQQLQKAVGSSSFESLVKDLAAGKIQSKIKETLRKIYPINVFEVRKVYILSKAEARDKRATAKMTVEPLAEAEEKSKSEAEPEEPKLQPAAEAGEPSKPAKVESEEEVELHPAELE